MKELSSRKTGKVKGIVSEEEWIQLVDAGKSRLFVTRDIPEIKKIVPTPKLLKAVEVEIKKIKATKK
jgi:hypothetical protein